MVNDLTTVAGCPFQVPVGAGTKPQPCVKVQWPVPATRVKVDGQPVLLQTSTGLCQSAEQIPQGPPVDQPPRSSAGRGGRCHAARLPVPDRAAGPDGHRVRPDAHVRDLIEQVLFTMPGERVMRPTFGIGLAQLVFQPNSDELATAVAVPGPGQPAAVARRADRASRRWTVTSSESTLEVRVQYVDAADPGRGRAVRAGLSSREVRRGVRYFCCDDRRPRRGRARRPTSTASISWRCSTLRTSRPADAATDLFVHFLHDPTGCRTRPGTTSSSRAASGSATCAWSTRWCGSSRGAARPSRCWSSRSISPATSRPTRCGWRRTDGSPLPGLDPVLRAVDFSFKVDCDDDVRPAARAAMPAGAATPSRRWTTSPATTPACAS